MSLVTTDVYRLAALNSPWTAAHFCQMIRTNLALATSNYEATLSMYSVNSGGSCHTGMAFNWVDSDNYDFFYIRSFSPNLILNFSFIAKICKKWNMTYIRVIFPR